MDRVALSKQQAAHMSIDWARIGREAAVKAKEHDRLEKAKDDVQAAMSEQARDLADVKSLATQLRLVGGNEQLRESIARKMKAKLAAFKEAAARSNISISSIDAVQQDLSGRNAAQP